MLSSCDAAQALEEELVEPQGGGPSTGDPGDVPTVQRAARRTWGTRKRARRPVVRRAGGRVGESVLEAGGARGEHRRVQHERRHVDVLLDERVEEADQTNRALRVGVQRRQPQQQALH